MNLWDWLFPLKCVGCGKEDVCLCDECRSGLVKANQKCPECEKPAMDGWVHARCERPLGMDGVWMMYGYHKLMQRIIKAIKYRFCKDLVGVCLENKEISRVFGEVDYLVPIPLHRQRENWRGFNQAEVIAGYVAGEWGVPVVEGLRRVKQTKAVAEMENKSERKKEVRGVFEVVAGMDFKSKKVVLVDDVFTSGATMKEAAKVLKRAGAEKIFGWVLAG